MEEKIVTKKSKRRFRIVLYRMSGENVEPTVQGEVEVRNIDASKRKLDIPKRQKKIKGYTERFN